MDQTPKGGQEIWPGETGGPYAAAAATEPRTGGRGSTIFLVAAGEMMKTHTRLLAAFHPPSLPPHSTL